MNKSKIIEREAEYLVSMGVYDSISDAWGEAKSICESNGSFDILDDYDDAGRYKYEYDEENGGYRELRD